MSTFLSSLNDQLTTMEQEMQTLPGELDSIVTRLDRGKLTNLLSHLNENCNETSDKRFAVQRALGLPFITIGSYPYIREITDEDLARWRTAYKSEVRVVLGKEGVGLVAVSELARKDKTTVSQVILSAQRQGYIVLGWDEYQNLLDEIGSLIGEDEEPPPEVVVGIPVTTTNSTQEVKILPKSPPS